MASPRCHADTAYSPNYFLAALGNGGLAVSFFIYLMFLLPHPGTPIPTFGAVAGALARADAVSALVAVALAGILWFAGRHYRLMVWNLRACVATRRAHGTCAPGGSAEVTMMAGPLAGAMSINVMFILGALFVPGLWSVVEWLFPAALAGFAAMGWLALRILTRYLTRLLTEGGYRGPETAGFGQLIATFALVMVAVGFAAPAAMSHTPLTVALGFLGSVFFLSAAGILGLAWLVMGLRDVKEHGIAPEAAPSLWIVIPVLTVSGIALVRLSHGMPVLWPEAVGHGAWLPLMAVILSVQILFGLLGWAVMTRLDYFRQYLGGARLSAGSYALICPGVAMMVFGMFFLHLGLVKGGLVEKYSLLHLALMVPLAYLQVRTIWTTVRLDRLHFGRRADRLATAAAGAD
ncbi:TsoY family (seleno)protein [Roseospira goensis]|uniref:Uncharacterized protein n=1 Tax=Roseospira goensis TaxID=391922 RepID=A0A7W6S2E7_9PROT|nr:hypothetical protein [Roseospira goensis]MBB4287633.1 hypothetical protein [Roseospira goensis]